MILLICLSTLCFWIAYVDLREYRIPNLANLLIFLMGMVAIGFKDFSYYNLGVVLAETVVVFTVMFAFTMVVEFIRSEIGFGMGDVKLIAAATPWIGMLQIPWMLVFACSGAVIYAIVKAHVLNVDISKLKIAFGPFLSLSILAFAWTDWMITSKL